jgi:hypothetical protein
MMPEHITANATMKADGHREQRLGGGRGGEGERVEVSLDHRQAAVGLRSLAPGIAARTRRIPS